MVFPTKWACNSSSLSFFFFPFLSPSGSVCPLSGSFLSRPLPPTGTVRPSKFSALSLRLRYRQACDLRKLFPFALFPLPNFLDILEIAKEVRNMTVFFTFKHYPYNATIYVLIRKCLSLISLYKNFVNVHIISNVLLLSLILRL